MSISATTDFLGIPKDLGGALQGGPPSGVSSSPYWGGPSAPSPPTVGTSPGGSVAPSGVSNFASMLDELLADPFGRKYQTSERLSTQTFNADEAEKARAFNDYLSSTAYQRAVADMRAAGVNPGMIYSQGGQGASSPSSPAASSPGGHGAVAPLTAMGQFASAITSLMGIHAANNRNMLTNSVKHSLGDRNLNIKGAALSQADAHFNDSYNLAVKVYGRDFARHFIHLSKDQQQYFMRIFRNVWEKNRNE